MTTKKGAKKINVPCSARPQGTLLQSGATKRMFNVQFSIK